MQTERERVMLAITEKETQLFQTSKLANSWNSGRHKSAGNTQASKLHVLSLKKEIKALRAELAVINNSGI